MTHNHTTSILHEVEPLIDILHIKGRIDDNTYAFYNIETHPGLLYSTDYQKYTKLLEGACRVTADVVSMYNNIPHREAI